MFLFSQIRFDCEMGAAGNNIVINIIYVNLLAVWKAGGDLAFSLIYAVKKQALHDTAWFRLNLICSREEEYLYDADKKSTLVR